MTEEILVLRRQKGIDQPLREIGILQLHAPFTSIGMDDLAINPAHHCGQRGFIDQQRLSLGQIARQQSEGGNPHHHRNGQPARQAQLEQHAIAPFLPKPRRVAPKSRDTR
jgi:hypothetical protein